MNIMRRIEQQPIDIARGNIWRHPQIPNHLFEDVKALREWLRHQGVTSLVSFYHDQPDDEMCRASGLIPIQIKHSANGYAHAWVANSKEAV